MARTKTRNERLMGAAVLKLSFRLRGQEDTVMFKAIYPGVLEDLDVTDHEVNDFLATHKQDVEERARAAVGKHIEDA